MRQVVCAIRSILMEKKTQEQPKEPRNWGAALPIGGMSLMLAFGFASCTHDKLTISAQEVEDAIYAKYGQCLIGTTYASGGSYRRLCE